MKKKKAITILIIVIAAIIYLAYLSFGILKGTVKEDESGISLGLDLSGGVSITYQAEDGATSEEMSDTVYKLQKRVESYSTEATVYMVGDDRITVEIPGVTDAQEILEDLGTPGSLEFQTEDGEVFLTEDMIEDAQAATQEDSTTGATEYVVELTFTDEGAEIFAEYTEENVGNCLPIYLDDECISYPEVQEAITDGSAVITGMDSWEDAENLASMIRIGSLSVELTELQSEIVGAKLGEEAVKTSIIAAIIGVFLIILFLIALYRVPGIAASLSLLIYCGLMLFLLQIYEVTLTLPGIAGIILSIGMAVDADIIIFSRIKEEIAHGRIVDSAIENGFKKATSAILDGNITTLIAAVVLYIFGSGTVRGFAITLAIGIVLSMVTALFITKWILRALYFVGLREEKFYGKAKYRKPLPIIQKRKVFFAASLCIILIGAVTLGVNKTQTDSILNFSLEFAGGTSSTVEFAEDYSINEIDSEIVPIVEQVASDVETQKVEDSTSVVIKTNTLDADEREELYSLLEDNFEITDISYENISATISKEMRNDAILAVIIAAICMLLYIRIRFKQMSFAAAAVIALMHDVLVVFTFYAISRISIGTTFIACMLTLLGYSINATIVIFDRIRENLSPVNDYIVIANESITQTLSRSINTTITTFIMVFVLTIVGVSSIREFSIPLMVGIICGMYSSVCLAGSIWYMMIKNKKK